MGNDFDLPSLDLTGLVNAEGKNVLGGILFSQSNSMRAFPSDTGSRLNKRNGEVKAQRGSHREDSSH